MDKQPQERKAPDRSMGANLEKMREQAVLARKKCIGVDEEKADALKNLIGRIDELIAKGREQDQKASGQ